MSGSTLEWVNNWPVPSGLVAPAVAGPLQPVRMELADGSHRTGEILAAHLSDQVLVLDWKDDASNFSLQWPRLRSVTRLTPLQARSVDMQGAQLAPGATTAQQALWFHIRLADSHGGMHITGHSMGVLSGSLGVFFYIEQPDGTYLAQWFSADALDFVQLDGRIWRARVDGPGSLDRFVNPPVAAQEPTQFTPGAALAGDGIVSAQRPGVTSIPQLLAAIATLRALPVDPVEKVILDLGYLSREALAFHVSRQQGHRDLLGYLLGEGLLAPEQGGRVLARLASVPEVDLESFVIQPDAALLDLRHARRYMVCPLGGTADGFFVASSTPTDKELVTLLSPLLNRRVQLVWASAHAIGARLAQLGEAARRPLGEAVSGAGAEQQVRPAAPAKPETKPAAPEQEADLDWLLKLAVADVDGELPFEQTNEIVETSSFVQLVKRIIQDARQMNVSDIHIETNPGQKVTRIRFRRDGDLETYLELPAALRAPLISRIKVMARLDISERRRAQDGKINFAEFGGSNLELRVAILPTHDGLEDVVMRLLASGKPTPLANLGFLPRDVTKVRAMAARSFGLILAAGPTGSGKTTTLHSLLKEVNTDQRKIWTAEDPIEITQEGLRQVQVNPKIGVTFASAMRAFLRADPDVIMIGEIRDDETAKIAIEGSLTGHLVLSTLHTNSAAESVSRLLDLGMNPMNFADALVGIVAQRLVRALCQQCAVSSVLSEPEVDALVREYVEGSPINVEEGRRRLEEAAMVNGEKAAFMVKTPVGCPHCGGKGYKGRMGVYEILENNARIRDLIQRHGRATEIFDAAVQTGMRSLRHDAMEKMLQGKIDAIQARIAYG